MKSPSDGARPHGRDVEDRVLAAAGIAPADAVYNALAGFALSIQVYDAAKEGRLASALRPTIRIETGGRPVSIVWVWQGDGLALTAFNGVLAALGNAAIIADTALEGLGPRAPLDTTPAASERAVIFLVRCAFAHGPQGPRWRVEPKYRRVYDIPALGIRIDGAALNGRAFQMDDVGGLDRFIALLHSVHQRLRSAGATA